MFALTRLVLTSVVVFAADPCELSLLSEFCRFHRGEPAALAGVCPKTRPRPQFGPELLSVRHVVPTQTPMTGQRLLTILDLNANIYIKHNRCRQPQLYHECIRIVSSGTVALMGMKQSGLFSPATITDTCTFAIGWVQTSHQCLLEKL